MLPKISIITPSFNQAEFLEELILSVIDQNYPNTELIIMDGGSTDGSLDIIKKYEKYIAYWVSEEDRGQTHAINKGLKVASGDLIGWQNSDDFYTPGAFSTVSEEYQKDSSYDVYYGHKYDVDKVGNIYWKSYVTTYNLITFIIDTHLIFNQSVFWKRALVDKIGYLDESLYFSMDREYFIRMGVNKVGMKFINQFLGCLRHYPETKQGNLYDSEKVQDEDNYFLKKFGYNKIKYIPLKIFLSRMRRLMLYILQGNIGAVTQRLGYYLGMNKTGVSYE